MELQVKLVLFRLYLLVRGTLDAAFSVTKKVVVGAVRALEPRIYYFLKGYTTPYHEHAVNIHASTSASVDFVYNAENKTFHDVSEFTVAKYLPILSLEIIRDDEAVYDLTDFIESMTVIADVSAFRYPSVSQIVNAWAIGSQIVFDPAIDFKVRCVSSEGETYEFNITDTIDLAAGMKEADDAETVEPVPEDGEVLETETPVVREAEVEPPSVREAEAEPPSVREAEAEAEVPETPI